MLEKINIGTNKIEYPIFLAPLAGYTNSVFRKIIKKYSYNCPSVTEMISVKCIKYNPDRSIKHIDKNLDYIANNDIIQLFGNDANEMKEVVGILLNKYNIKNIDINCGCPARKVRKTGAGSTLLETPEIIVEMINNIKTSYDVNLSVKIRIGQKEFDIDKYIDLIEKLAQTKLDALFIHLRTVKQKFSGKINYESLKIAVDMLDIPVIGNGDIINIESAEKMIDKTNCNGLMIGRGILTDYLLIKKIVEKLCLHKTDIVKNRKNIFDIFYEFCKDYSKTFGEVVTLRKYGTVFFKNFDGCKKYRSKFCYIESLDDINNIMKDLKVKQRIE